MRQLLCFLTEEQSAVLREFLINQFSMLNFHERSKDEFVFNLTELMQE